MIVVVKTFPFSKLFVASMPRPPRPPLLHHLYPLTPLPQCRFVSQWQQTPRYPPLRDFKDNPSSPSSSALNPNLKFTTSSPYSPSPPSESHLLPHPDKVSRRRLQKSAGAPHFHPSNRFKKKPDYEIKRLSRPLDLRPTDGGVCRGCGIPLQSKDKGKVGFKYVKSVADENRVQEWRKKMEETVYFRVVREAGKANLENLANTEEKLRR